MLLAAEIARAKARKGKQESLAVGKLEFEKTSGQALVEEDCARGAEVQGDLEGATRGAADTLPALSFHHGPQSEGACGRVRSSTGGKEDAVPEPKQGRDREILTEEQTSRDPPACGEPLSMVEMEKELARIETGREARLLAKYGVPETLQVPTTTFALAISPHERTDRRPHLQFRLPVCTDTCWSWTFAGLGDSLGGTRCGAIRRQRWTGQRI